MKPRLTTLIAFLFVAMSNLWGQNEAFAPIGARWYYRPGETMQYLNTRLYTFTVTKDTLLDGLVARELSCSAWEDGQFKDYPNLNKYVYTTTDSVLYRVENQWVLLFDFGAMPGDTILSKVTSFEYFAGCNAPVRLLNYPTPPSKKSLPICPNPPILGPSTHSCGTHHRNTTTRVKAIVLGRPDPPRLSGSGC
jgi:hypothetical protein